MELADFLNEMQSGFLVLKQEKENYVIVYANKILSDILGTDLSCASFPSVIYPADSDIIQKALKKSSAGHVFKDTYRLKNKRGMGIWLMGAHKKVNADDGTYICITYSNIQNLMESKNKLEASNAKLQDIVDSVPVGLGIFSIENDVATTITVNNHLLELANNIGHSLDGTVRHWTKEALKAIFDQDLYTFATKEDIVQVRTMLSDSATVPVSSCVFRLRGSTDENTVWIRCSCCSKGISKKKRNYYITFEDATKDIQTSNDLIQNHEMLLIMSYYDALTGLHNRNAFNNTLENASTNILHNTGIAFADVNGLKNVNDTLGHRYGDSMILHFGELLQNEFSNNDVYRISGDEFVIISSNIPENIFSEKMNRLIAVAHEEEDIASIGYIWYERLSDIKDALLKAEQLMYIDKQHYYASQKAGSAAHRPKLLKQLMDDIANDRYILYLQPKANIDSINIIGAEALVRRIDHNGKIIYPDDFIPKLEKERLIAKLDFYMLEQTCKLLHRWKEEGRKLICISVNISRVTLAENNFIRQVTEICDKYNVDHSLVELEITESTETINYNKLIEEITEIHRLGFKISLDDMGTDYSSLRMLLIDGITSVKLDRDFILQMNTTKGKALLQHVIGMCHELGLSCIAEGVEDNLQRIKLQNMRCDSYQGYLLSRPVPVADFETLM